MKTPRGRELDPDWSKGRKLYQHELFKPTFINRIKILLGWNIVISMKVFTQHSPGKCAVGLFAVTTTAIDVNDPRLERIAKSETGEFVDLPAREEFEKHDKERESVVATGSK